MKLPRLAAFTFGASLLASCANPIIDDWAFPQAEVSVRWTAHGTPLANALVNIRAFPKSTCGEPGTADGSSSVRLDAAGRYAGRVNAYVPVDTIVTRCVTVTFLAPYQSGARDTTVTVNDVTFRYPGRDGALDTIRVSIAQP